MAFSTIRLVKGSGAVLAVMMVGAMSLSGQVPTATKSAGGHAKSPITATTTQHAAAKSGFELASVRPGV